MDDEARTDEKLNRENFENSFRAYLIKAMPFAKTKEEVEALQKKAEIVLGHK